MTDSPDTGRRPIRRALVSVYDKTELIMIAEALVAADVEIVSTGSTAKTIADAGLPATALTIELTESVLVEHDDAMRDLLMRLKDRGIRLAIHHFGTGHSSLSYLHRFPVHTIKIDQSFVKEIHDEYGHYPVVLAIISIARGLGLNLIAEGVETESQARYLRANGCMTMQGYLYHRPMPLPRFTEVLCSQGLPAGAGNVLVFQA